MGTRARRRPGVDVGHRDHAVLGHERVGDDDVVRAGAAHARGMPGVDDLHPVGGHQHQRRVDPVRPLDERPDHHPVGGHRAGRPRPPARQPDPAVGRDAAAGGGQGSGRQHRPRGEHLLLHPQVEQRQHPVVQGVEAQRPRAGRAAVRHPPNRLQQFGKRRLQAAEPGGQQQPEQLGLPELGDGGRGQPAQPLSLLGALGQAGHEFVGDPVRRASVDRGHGADRTILFCTVM